jgi:isoquinoline 1-oxidoreductase alpha subunit
MSPLPRGTAGNCEQGKLKTVWVTLCLTQIKQLMPQYNLNINGKNLQADVAADTPLLWVLRDHLGLVGTKYGCGIGQCGACTVHFDGYATRSCMLPVSAVKSAKITTIDVLSENGDHFLQIDCKVMDVPQ